MSKGPGRIQRAIETLFKENPDSSFTIEELCEHLYGSCQKRHRVAVLRAATTVAKNFPDIVVWRAEWRGGTLIFLNHRSVMSYATARLKGDCIEHRLRQWQHRWGRGDGTLSDKEARRILREDERHMKLISPQGAWTRHVAEWIAERDGDSAKVEQLKALSEAAHKEWLAEFARLRGR